MENCRLGDVKNENVCKSSAKQLFAKEASMDRKDPGTIHQANGKKALKGISASISYLQVLSVYLHL